MDQRVIPGAAWRALALGAVAALAGIVVAAAWLVGGPGSTVAQAFAVATLIVWGVLGTLAVTRGVATWRAIRRNPDELRGRAHAAVAVLLGLLGLSAGLAPPVVLAAVTWYEARTDMGRWTTPDVVAALAGGSVGERVRAAGEIGDRGAVEAVPALASALVDPSAAVRSAAALALDDLQAAAAPAVPALISALSDPDPLVRRHAAYALAEVGEAAVPAIQALLRMLADPTDRDPAQVALHGIGGARNSVQAFLEGLANDHPAVREGAWNGVVAAMAVAPGQRAQPVPGPLRAALAATDARVRRGAVWVLARQRHWMEELEPILAPVVDDADPATRLGVACAIAGKRGAPTTERARAITVALGVDPLALVAHEPEGVRLTLLEFLPRIARPDQVEAAALERSLARERLAPDTAAALGEWAAGTPALRAVFRGLVRDDDGRLRPEVLRGLARAGGLDDELLAAAVAELRAAQAEAADPRSDIRAGWILDALADSRRPDVAPVLVGFLGDPAVGFHTQAAQALSQLGTVAAGVVPQLVELLRTRVSTEATVVTQHEGHQAWRGNAVGRLRRQVASALASIDPDPAHAIAEIVTALDDPDPLIRRELVRVIAGMTYRPGATPAAREALTRLTAHADAAVQTAAREALERWVKKE